MPDQPCPCPVDPAWSHEQIESKGEPQRIPLQDVSCDPRILGLDEPGPCRSTSRFAVSLQAGGDDKAVAAKARARPARP